MRKFKLSEAGKRALEYAKEHGQVDDRTFQYKTISSLEQEKLLEQVKGKPGVHKAVVYGTKVHIDFVNYYALTPKGLSVLEGAQEVVVRE